MTRHRRLAGKRHPIGPGYPDIQIIYVDPRPHFDRNNQDYLVADGIHPNAAGSAKLANLLWGAMVANGIEQNMPCPGNGGGGCN